MTKCIVLGGTESPKSSPKKIEPLLMLGYGNTGAEFYPDPAPDLAALNFIELIARNYVDGKDLFFGYDNPSHRGGGILYLGHWNDGVV